MDFKIPLEMSLEKEKTLIKWFKNNSDTINYINDSGKYSTFSAKRKDKTKNLIEKLDEKKHLNRPRNFDKLIDLWYNILGDAIIFLKSKDTREQYHDGEIFGTDKLYKILKEFKEFEKILFGASDYYRDHITHVFRVYLMGVYLIKNTIGFEKISLFNKYFDKKVSREEKEAMWAIIALTHDLGYALESIEKINNRVRQMIKQYGKADVQELGFLFPPQRQSIDDFVISFISSNIEEKKDVIDKKKYLTHMQSKYFLKFSRAYENFDHGIISCTVLMRELVYFLESDFLIDKNKLLKEEDARQFLIRQNILRSIASHNCEDIYHLKATNFPFLLLIFDELQEWGRPRMEDIFRQKAPNTIVKLNKFELKNQNAKNEIFNFEYKVVFKKDKLTSDEKEALAKDILNYFIRKTKKYIKILRCAVKGELKSINFTFIVEDQTLTNEYKLEIMKPKEGDQLKPIIYEQNEETDLKKLYEKLENN